MCIPPSVLPLTNKYNFLGNNVHEKIYALLIGLKLVHSDLTQVQSCNMSANYIINK